MTIDFPRRHCLDRLTPAELSIKAAVDAVEAMPADPRLTDAVIILAAARDRVADFVEGVERKMSDTEILNWLLDALFGDDTDAKMVRVAGALMLGKTGREAVMAAIQAEK
jgi:hypothetical protein